jgi:endonuclease YncB( thermonuclease family)
MRALFLAILIVLLGIPASGLAADISSYAFVNDDGSLRIRGRTVHLYGIEIPPTNRICRDFILPVKCAPRAALALDFKIGPSFVHCDVKGEKPDGSLIATCWVDDVDLAAYLLERGWAVALPHAPARYQALERIARHRGVGVWGIPVDRIIPTPDLRERHE